MIRRMVTRARAAAEVASSRDDVTQGEVTPVRLLARSAALDGALVGAEVAGDDT